MEILLSDRPGAAVIPAMKQRSWSWTKRIILSRWYGLRVQLAGPSEKRFRFYPAARPFLKGGFPTGEAEIPQGGCLTYRPNPVAGIGHQSSAWITAHNLAQALGLTFVHRPLDPEWDDFLGLPIGEQSFTDPRVTGLRRISLPRFAGEEPFDRRHPIAHIVARELRKGPCLFFTEYDQASFDLSPARAALHRKFFAAHPELAPGASPGGSLRVALHVRRGDIIGLKDARTDLKYSRFLPEAYYIGLADTLRRSVTSRPLEFHIFSDGSATDLPEISRSLPGAVWHLDASAQETFRELCQADILAVGRSGFSFLAGLINPGIKISTTPWWHKIPDTADWLQVAINGETGMYSFQDLADQLKMIAPEFRTPTPL